MTAFSKYINIYETKSYCPDCEEWRDKGIRCPECKQRMRNRNRGTWGKEARY